MMVEKGDFFMDIKILLVILFFVILISIQYTLNLILREVREIRKFMVREEFNRMGEKVR